MTQSALYGALVLLSGTAIAFTAKMAGTDVPSSTQIVIRSLLCLLVAPCLGTCSFATLHKSAHGGWLLLRGFLGFLASISSVEAVRKLPISTVTLVTRMHPVLGPGMVRLLSGERVLPGQVVGYLAGCVGISVATPEDTWRATSLYSYGFNYAMAAAVCTGLSLYCVFRLARAEEDPGRLQAAFHIANLVGGLAIGFQYHGFVQPTPLELGFIAAGAAATLLLQWALGKLFEKGAEPGPAVFWLYFSAPLSKALAVLIDEKPPQQNETLGLFLVAVGVACACFDPFAPQARAEGPAAKKGKKA